ncbi:cardiolipin synthase [Desulfolithobacter sp.]
MNQLSWIVTTIIFLADLGIRIGLSLRVIMRKREPSVTMAWLVVILLIPFAGAIIYLLFGENRLGERRARRAAADLQRLAEWARKLSQRPQVDWFSINPECEPIHRQADAILGIPALPSNDLALLASSEDFFHSLLKDINQARSSCFLEFYIWHRGGLADEVINALIRAARRGVTCRILLDSIGSKPFLKSTMVRKMRHHGIQVVEALPAGILRALFVRIDLRNHRKIVVIDGEIGYTGSQNLVDPRYFKQDQGVGQWIDTMVRIRGPIVEVLSASFLHDWMMESGENFQDIAATSDNHAVAPAGDAPVQLVPSGPGITEGAIHNLLLTTIYAARRELIITTPYFVPDNALLIALKSAAMRGVEVTLIVPEKNDSRLVHYASQARYGELIRSGVRIMAFTGGLLHAKTISVDNDFCLIGSVNLDMRSFWLNFELTLFVYNKKFTSRLRRLQMEYCDAARELTHDQLQARPLRQRFLENTALILGPLL